MESNESILRTEVAIGLLVRRRSRRTALHPTDGHHSRRRRLRDEAVQHATPAEAWAAAQVEATAAVPDAAAEAE